MQPQDHSDTTLLVWSDWLEENGQEQKAHDLREEIATPLVKRWDWEHRPRATIASTIGVGGFVSINVGCRRFGTDVAAALLVGGTSIGAHVGDGGNLGIGGRGDGVGGGFGGYAVGGG